MFQLIEERMLAGRSNDWLVEWILEQQYIGIDIEHPPGGTQSQTQHMPLDPRKLLIHVLTEV
jgi:hypothetical protein